MSSSPSAPNSAEPSAARSSRVVVLGGGEAGLALLQALAESDVPPDVILIEPSSHHFEQRTWMQVGTEGMDKEQTQSDLRTHLPEFVTWTQDSASNIDPEEQTVTTQDGERVSYDYLVVALGTRVHWDRIRGLKENLGRHGLCSVYGYEQAERTWDMIRRFEGGRALFTAPSTPFKGGSAPLSILRKAESLWRTSGVHDQTDLYFATAASSTFAGEAYADLMQRAERDDHVHVYTGYELIDVRPDRREAVFSVTKGQSQSKDVLPYDLLHAVPPMRPPELIEESRLALRDGPMRGYLDVHPDTLRHKHFDTIFGVGDAIGVEGVKTAERAREQADSVARVLKDLVGEAG